jgi:hypothetical protein
MGNLAKPADWVKFSSNMPDIDPFGVSAQNACVRRGLRYAYAFIGSCASPGKTPQPKGDAGNPYAAGTKTGCVLTEFDE